MLLEDAGGFAVPKSPLVVAPKLGIVDVFGTPRAPVEEEAPNAGRRCGSEPEEAVADVVAETRVAGGNPRGAVVADVEGKPRRAAVADAGGNPPGWDSLCKQQNLNSDTC